MDESKMTELNKALEGMWDSLTDEQKTKVKECQSMDELTALAGEVGVELPNEMLDAVAGGYSTGSYGYRAVSATQSSQYCPYCKRKHNVTAVSTINDAIVYHCDNGDFYIKEKKCFDRDGKYLGDYVDSTPKSGCG